jgi:hypothetical protein
MKLEISQQILKNSQRSNFMKIRPVGAELFNSGRRTGRRTGRNDKWSRFAILPKRLKILVNLIMMSTQTDQNM